MSRRTTVPDLFVPSKGIRQDVLDHQLENIFGSRARFRKSSTREGWVISNSKKLTNDPIKQLRSLTELLNATREREAAERQRKESLVGNKGASVLPISERASRGPFAQERAQARHQDHPDTSAQDHTTGLASRYLTDQSSFDLESSLHAPSPAPHVQLRNDGHSPRSSSLQVNATKAIPIPSKKDRHQKTSGYGESYNEAGSFQASSLNQGASIPRYGNQGTQDPSLAANDVTRQYEEQEFRDFRDWQEYKSLRRIVDAERNPQRRRHQSEQDVPDDYTTNSLSRLSLGPVTVLKPTHRHSDKKSRGDTAASQNTRAKPKSGIAKVSKHMQDVAEDSEFRSEARDRDSSPDGTIGHAKTSAKDRHRDTRSDPRQTPKIATKDFGPSTRQPSTYATDTRSSAVQNYSLSTPRVVTQSRGDYENEEDFRRPRSQRGESYYEDEQVRRNRHADAEAAYVAPNTGRRMDREYKPDSDRWR